MFPFSSSSLTYLTLNRYQMIIGNKNTNSHSRNRCSDHPPQTNYKEVR